MNQKLSFNERLISTARKPVSTKELLSRLEVLSDELSSLDQDEVDSNSLEHAKSELINRKLIHHSNAGVQSYTACCIVDILRLYAPDAPYSAPELSQVFRLFFRQLNGLLDPENGYYSQYMYLATRIAEVKIAVLLTDLPDAPKLAEGLFQVVYHVASVNNLDKELKPILLEMLTEVISESNTLSDSVMKLMLNKFLQHFKQVYGHQPSHIVPAFGFTVTLFTLNADRLSRLVTLFFSEIIYDALKFSKEDGDEYSSSGSESDNESNDDSLSIRQLVKVNQIVIEIWKYVPEVTSSVMGLLSNELEAENDNIRVASTKAIESMLSFQTSPLNFLHEHHDVYKKWLKKPFDRSMAVRIAWVKRTPRLVEHRSDTTDDIRDGLLKMMVDSEAEVRLTTIQALQALSPATFISKIASDSVMDTLYELMREKHSQIRVQCINFLAHLYNVQFSNLYSGNDELDKWIGSFPDHLFNLIYINDKLVNSEVDIALVEKLFSYQPDSKKRINKILAVFSHLGTKAKSAFFALARRQVQLSGFLPKLLEFAEEVKGEDDDDERSQNYDNSESSKKLDRGILWLSADMPQYGNPAATLKRFLLIKNKRLFRLARLTISPMTSDYETVQNSLSELLEVLKNDESNANPKLHLYGTVKLLMYRAACICYNKSNVPELLAVARESTNPFSSSAIELIDSISSLTPEILKSNIMELISEVCEENVSVVIVSDLRAIVNFVRKFPTVVNDKLMQESSQRSQSNLTFYEKLVRLATKGSPLEARYSVQIIANANFSLRESYLQDILEGIWPLSDDARELSTALSSISEIFLADILLLEPKTKELSSFLASKILLKNNFIGERQSETEATDIWISDDQLLAEDQSCYIKLLALRCLTNWLVAVKSDTQSDLTSLSEPIFKLLRSIIVNGGEIVPKKDSTYPTPKAYQSRLRLAAGLMLLRLAECESYDGQLNESVVQELVFLVQDENKNVRGLFLNSLTEKLSAHTIPKKFVPLVMFYAHEPDESIQRKAATWIRSTFNRELDLHDSWNDLLFETSYVRLIHMLSYHSEFKNIYQEYISTEENTDDRSQAFYNLSAFTTAYLSFAVGIIATADNISLLFYLAQRVKQYQSISFESGTEDSDQQHTESKEKDERLYFVSDLAQLVVKQIAEMRKWYTTTWPGKIALPSDLYQKNRSKELVQDVVKSTFIPEQYLNEVTRIVKTSCKRFKNLPKNKTIGKRARQEKNDEQRKVSIVDIDAEEVMKEKMPLNRRETIATRVLRRGGD